MSGPLDRFARPCEFLYNWFYFFFFSSHGFSSLCNFGGFLFTHFETKDGGFGLLLGCLCLLLN